MKNILLITLLATNLTVFGQHNFGLKANGGLSKISTNLNSSISTIPFVPSGHGGLFYNLQLGDKSLLGAELLFIQIEGKERIETPEIDHGIPTGELIINNFWRHISYIGLPIYYGLKIKKLTINLGFQASFTLTSFERKKGQAPYNGGIITWDNKYDKLYIDSYDFGPRAGLIFNLTDKFAIEGMYYYGINNILDNDITIDRTWRVQQVTVGFRYAFPTKTKNEKEQE